MTVFCGPDLKPTAFHIWHSQPDPTHQILKLLTQPDPYNASCSVALFTGLHVILSEIQMQCPLQRCYAKITCSLKPNHIIL